MNKSDLLENLKSKKDSISEEDLASSIHLNLQFISSTLGEAKRVEIRNIGTFTARKEKTDSPGIQKQEQLIR